MTEIWKDIKGYEGLYQVSNLGRVKSLDIVDRLGRKHKSNIKYQNDNGNGYLIVNLKHNGKQKNHLVHRLVAEAFIENPENKKEVNHIDGDKLNNRVDNLEWVSRSENLKHAFKLGLNKNLKGINHPKFKLTIEQVKFIKENAIPHDPEYSFENLGRKFNISSTVVKKIYYQLELEEVS